MNKYLFRKSKSLRVFSKALSSSWATYINTALLIALFISLITPYQGIGIIISIIICAVEVLFIASLYILLRSRRSRYRVIKGELEWIIDNSKPGIIRAKKRYTIKLLQTTNSICYYLEPSERIIETPNLLAVFSQKRCEDKNYGYVPVELYFSSYHPKGTEIPVEIETEIVKATTLNSGTISFHTHNKPQQLDLYFKISKNGRDHQLNTKLEYEKGRHVDQITSSSVTFRRQDTSRKLIWESKDIADDAVYKIHWEYE